MDDAVLKTPEAERLETIRLEVLRWLEEGHRLGTAIRATASGV